jgi:DNA replication and repair protein RecF
VDGLEARTRASQGEQRTTALALRLAAHRLCIEITDEEPVLLLDDVLSELDAHRAVALLEQLAAEQTLLTTAGTLPEVVRPARVVHVVEGNIAVGNAS